MTFLVIPEKLSRMANLSDRPAEWLSVTKVADHFGVSDSTVRRWARAGLIRHAVMPSGRLRFPPEALREAVIEQPLAEPAIANTA